MDYVTFYKLWCTHRGKALALLHSLSREEVSQLSGINHHPPHHDETGRLVRKMYFAGETIFHQTARDGDIESFTRLIEIVTLKGVDREDLDRVLTCSDAQSRTPLILALLYNNLEIALLVSEVEVAKRCAPITDRDNRQLFHTAICMMSHCPCPRECNALLVDTRVLARLNPLDYVMMCVQHTTNPCDDRFLTLVESVAQSREATPHSLSTVIRDIIRSKLDARLVESLIKGYASRYGSDAEGVKREKRNAESAFSAHLAWNFRFILQVEGPKKGLIENTLFYFRKLVQSIAAEYGGKDGGKIRVSKSSLAQILTDAFTADHISPTSSETSFFDVILQNFDLSDIGDQHSFIQCAMKDIVYTIVRSKHGRIAPHVRSMFKALFALEDGVVTATQYARCCLSTSENWQHSNHTISSLIDSLYDRRATEVIADRQEVIDYLMMAGYSGRCHRDHLPHYGSDHTQKRCGAPSSSLAYYPEITESIDSFPLRLSLFSLLSFFYL